MHGRSTQSQEIEQRALRVWNEELVVATGKSHIPGKQEASRPNRDNISRNTQQRGERTFTDYIQ